MEKYRCLLLCITSCCFCVTVIGLCLVSYRSATNGEAVYRQVNVAEKTRVIIYHVNCISKELIVSVKSIKPMDYILLNGNDTFIKVFNSTVFGWHKEVTEGTDLWAINNANEVITATITGIDTCHYNVWLTILVIAVVLFAIALGIAIYLILPQRSTGYGVVV